MHALDGVLDVAHQRFEVGGRRLALVHDEVGVLLRHHRAANAVSLEPGPLDQLGGVAPGRVGEHGSATPGADRLARVALLEKFLDRPRVRIGPRLETEGRREEPFARDRRRHAAVAVAVLGGSAAMALAAPVDRLDFGHARPGLAAPGARVHRERAADRARDAGEEVRGPDQPFRALPAEPGAGHARLRAHALRAHALERVQDAVHREHGAADAAVAHQQVAAEPDPGHGHFCG